MLRMMGAIDEKTLVVTSVNDVQVTMCKLRWTIPLFCSVKISTLNHRCRDRMVCVRSSTIFRQMSCSSTT